MSGGLNYDKLKEKAESNEWTSYSDLFMVLSVVFLLLYVFTSMREGTNEIKQHIEKKKISRENQDLKKQIAIYNALKEEQLAKVTQEEQDVYKELMEKLTLLQDNSRVEKEALQKKAIENEQKERALNQYQQIVRNIINANMLAKGKIKRRDESIVVKNETIKDRDQTIVEKSEAIEEQVMVIDEKTHMIAEQDKEIDSKKQEIVQRDMIIEQKKEFLELRKLEMAKLERELERKKERIQQNESQIVMINQNLDEKVQELEKKQKIYNTSKAKLNEDIAKLKQQRDTDVQQLEAKTQEVSTMLATVSTELQKASTELVSAQDTITKQNEEKIRLASEIQAQQEKYKDELANLQQAHQAKMQAEKDAFDKQLNEQRLTVAEKAAKLKAFQEEMAGKAEKMRQEVAVLEGKVKETEQELVKSKDDLNKTAQDLEKAKDDRQRYLASIDTLKQENVNLSGDLKKAQEILNAKKKIADDIGRSFAKAGIKADVDGKTGDVTLSFGKEYFSTGSADLKDQMKDTLNQFMPIYTKSLFKDERIANKINSVEIVGFASPTYQGKYIDPGRLSEDDKAAVNYNMDLSYNRAKSIFNHLFEKDKMNDQYNKKLFPLVKVSGRSFLSEDVKGRDIASGLDQYTFCKQYDCQKAQRVIIKFNLKNN